MTTQEFSTEFDVLYNNITSNQAPGLNEYEKSVFLTKAQDQIVNENFNVRIDGVGGGFDGSRRRQYDFSQLIIATELKLVDPTTTDKKVDRRSVLFEFPRDYFLSVNEILSDSEYQYTVVPVDYEEYSRLMMKPYNLPVKRAVWRLFTGKHLVQSSDETYYVTVAEVIGRPTMLGNNPITAARATRNGVTYSLRYVKKPAPIILEDLTDYGTDLSIDGKTTESQCELPEATHKEILERAVTLAKIAWQGGSVTQAAAQSRDNR